MLLACSCITLGLVVVASAIVVSVSGLCLGNGKVSKPRAGNSRVHRREDTGEFRERSATSKCEICGIEGVILCKT